MNFIGNLIWILCGGLLSAIGWWIAGVFWCITVVGIPVGLQCFKMSSLSLDPFGKEVVDEGGAVSFLLNIIWLFVSGLELALANVFIGCILCILLLEYLLGSSFSRLRD
ncbi:hypothetical protein bhn_I1201 [Butyrivibrio hungatei]|uniref:Inner membrane component domain-containing protein n=1 Tax=Butyrivibrio hungatei TaxID=185008 RepID=A0A1D9P212_9FIRM|nr:YccF domain-containing protein [Butyrivibrio hungatei]AOZ96235.1 hypothetical protein bhn_I1201 [Butyrivibrio hungatei]